MQETPTQVINEMPKLYTSQGRPVSQLTLVVEWSEKKYANQKSWTYRGDTLARTLNAEFMFNALLLQLWKIRDRVLNAKLYDNRRIASESLLLHFEDGRIIVDNTPDMWRPKVQSFDFCRL